MVSYEPIIVLFGSSERINAVSLRLPVSFLLALDTAALDRLVNTESELTDGCLQRYFVVLLDAIDDDRLMNLQKNHRVSAIYTEHEQNNMKLTKVLVLPIGFQQLALTLTFGIVQFLTDEGKKQLKLERLSLVKIYYRQARQLKEWAMSFVKAEPCHVLLIPLNSSQANLDDTRQQLQTICAKLGYASAVIRTLSDYLPTHSGRSALLPYEQLIFRNDDPDYVCQLIKKLSPIRLYLYGNEMDIDSEWSKWIIRTETEVMGDEDNWCVFVANEEIDDEIKWNFGYLYSRFWQVKRLAPIHITLLTDNLPFRSALRRAHVLFAERKIDVTAEVFDWYDTCIKAHYLHQEPALTPQEAMKKPERRLAQSRAINNDSSYTRRFALPRTIPTSKIGLVSFIWLDELLKEADAPFRHVVEPFEWQCFDNVSACISFIEFQRNQEYHVFLITSGSLADDLFTNAFILMQQVNTIYVRSTDPNWCLKWTGYDLSIQGVYSDCQRLIEQLSRDWTRLQSSWLTNQPGRDFMLDSNEVSQSSRRLLQRPINVFDQEKPFPRLPITVYDNDQPRAFIAYQNELDTLLGAPQTDESLVEAFAEVRRFYSQNPASLTHVNVLEQSYHSNAALRYYTSDSSLSRIISATLRSEHGRAIFSIRRLVSDLYQQLDELHQQTHVLNPNARSETFYRGQSMSFDELDAFSQLQGRVISINTFWSTTTSMQLALLFAESSAGQSQQASVIFHVVTDPAARRTRPYADVCCYSMFPEEAEILFAMGSIFRVEKLNPPTRTDNYWVINLKTIDQNELVAGVFVPDEE